jgi:hypothetical protein
VEYLIAIECYRRKVELNVSATLTGNPSNQSPKESGKLAAKLLPNVRTAAKLSGCQQTTIGFLPAITANRELQRTRFTESSN